MLFDSFHVTMHTLVVIYISAMNIEQLEHMKNEKRSDKMKRWIVAGLCGLMWCSTGFAACVTTIPATTPTANFVDHGNGTVTDTKTGLMWKQCSEGLSGVACATGAPSLYTWQGALQAAQTLNAGGGFAGFTDWRVPNKKELISIVEMQCVTPGINTTIFPATVSNWYWSASPYASNTSYACGVGFGVSGASTNLKSINNYVRLVRGGQ